MRIFASRGLYCGYLLVEMRETVIITGWEGRFNHQWECQLLPEQFLADWRSLWVSRSLRWRCGLTVDCYRVGSAEYNSACTVLLNEVAIIFITPTTVWSQVKQQGGNTTLPINRKLDYSFTEHGPDHQHKTQFPPQSVSPIKKLP